MDDDLSTESVGDRHLNLFYTYQTRHLEDNVTRALVVALKNLAPVNLRLLLQDVVLAKQNSSASVRRLDLFAEGDFQFGLQVGQSDSDPLDAKTGVIAGITFSGNQFPRLGSSAIALGGSRPDALVTDEANKLTVIFEVKLTDKLYREQIQRHLRAFFTRSTRLKDVFIEITWSEIAHYLNRMARQSASDRERFVSFEFIRYLDWLRLVDFIGFNTGDFVADDVSTWKLSRFLTRMADLLGTDLGMREYNDNWKFFFEDVPYENIWFGMGGNGIDCGIVCGSGKMWRAQQMRDYIEADPEAFKAILDMLRQTLHDDFAMTLKIHAFFRHSMFRTGWLGYIGGDAYPYPDRYSDFVSVLCDRRLNSFEYLNKAEIQRRFEREIRKGECEVDERGRFPKYTNLHRFLQYAYIHVDVQVPPRRLIGSSLNDLLSTFKQVLEAEHATMHAITTALGA